MQLTTTQTLLFLLPLAAAATTTTTTTVANPTPNPNDVDVNPRGITNSVKGFFGDPVAKASELPECIAICAGLSLILLDVNEACDPVKDGIMNCLCNRVDGFTDPGAGWANSTRKCFDALPPQAGKKDDKEPDWSVRLGCTKPGAFDEGKLVDLCKASDGASGEKQNATVTALLDKLDNADKEGEGAEGKTAEGKAVENETGKESGAAAAAGAYAVARITGAVLAAAVGCAVAML